MVGSYKVITLCGGTRFKDAFLEAQKKLTHCHQRRPFRPQRRREGLENPQTEGEKGNAIHAPL